MRLRGTAESGDYVGLTSDVFHIQVCDLQILIEKMDMGQILLSEMVVSKCAYTK